jgi:alkane 1-monooxygenase
MLRYSGPFLFLASIPLLYHYAGPAGPLATVLGLLAVLIGVETVSPRGDVVDFADHPRAFRALVLLYIPLQLALILWAVMASASASITGFAALVLSVGVTTGVFGMLAAHEAVHSGDPFEGVLGTAMLTGMGYRHFRISHVHGHHRWAATARDPGTARIGEGFYRFLLRTGKEQVVMAWHFERKRRALRGAGRNRVLEDGLVMTLVCGGVVLLAGWRGLLFFVLQSAVAVIVLELFNYIAHYGLVRQTDAGGKPEALTDAHSWNSSNVLANALIFNMGRHSFHHKRPAAPFQGLQRIAAAPELPAGYAGSILLALAPPLWRRVMDDKVRRIGMEQA